MRGGGWRPSAAPAESRGQFRALMVGCSLSDGKGDPCTSGSASPALNGENPGALEPKKEQSTWCSPWQRVDVTRWLSWPWEGTPGWGLLVTLCCRSLCSVLRHNELVCFPYTNVCRAALVHAPLIPNQPSLKPQPPSCIPHPQKPPCVCCRISLYSTVPPGPTPNRSFTLRAPLGWRGSEGLKSPLARRGVRLNPTGPSIKPHTKQPPFSSGIQGRDTGTRTEQRETWFCLLRTGAGGNPAAGRRV